MDTATLTLTDFLLARVAEDERRIYACDSDGEFRATWLTFRRRDGSLAYTTIAADHRNEVWVADGTAYQADSRISVDEPFFDARRALAECEAKRRLVALHCQPTAIGPLHECIDFDGVGGGVISSWGVCDTLRLLALPYADHPDYRPEWRPSVG